MQEEEKKVHYKIFEKYEKIRHFGKNRSQIISFRAKTENILEGIEFSPARQRWVSVCDEALVLFEVGGHVQGNRGVPLDLAEEGGGDGLTRGW